jgi:hypothetical protein
MAGCSRETSVRAALLTLTVLSLAACSKDPPPEPEPEPEPAPPPTNFAADTLRQVRQQYAELLNRLETIQERAAAAELQLLAKDAQIADLEARLAAQQAMLDRATNEIVSAKAKVVGGETRAEAASELAEAEIALQALATRPAGPETTEYAQATTTLEQAQEAFEEENFGGTIFLTNQVKSLVQMGELKLGDRPEIETGADEVLFETPVRLEVVRNSNIRSGPGREHGVVTTVPRGSTVTGYSYVGHWIRVRLADGTIGWIYQSLVSGGR